MLIILTPGPVPAHYSTHSCFEMKWVIWDCSQFPTILINEMSKEYKAGYIKCFSRRKKGQVRMLQLPLWAMRSVSEW